MQSKMRSTIRAIVRHPHPIESFSFSILIEVKSRLGLLQFGYIQIIDIKTVRLAKRNAEHAHEGILDEFPVVDMDRVVQRSDDLDFHSGFDIDAVAAFAAAGSYFVECHDYKCSIGRNSKTFWSIMFCKYRNSFLEKA